MLLLISINLVNLGTVWLRTNQNALHFRTERVLLKLTSYVHGTNLLTTNKIYCANLILCEQSFVFFLTLFQQQVQTLIAEAKPWAAWRFGLACFLEKKWRRCCGSGFMVSVHCDPICPGNCCGDHTCSIGANSVQLAMIWQGCSSWSKLFFRPKVD